MSIYLTIEMSEKSLLETGKIPGTSATSPDNPPLGIAYFLIAGFFFCLNFTCGKILYTSQPSLTTIQLLSLRAVISMAIVSILNFG
jgi:hypothetical protein